MTEQERQVLRDLVFYCFERDIPVFKTGSRVIGGWTEESDWDYVIGGHKCGYDFEEDLDMFHQLTDLISDLGFTSVAERIVSTGANLETYGGVPEPLRNHIYRQGDLNIMVAQTQSEYNKWVEATWLTKKINPPTKAQRIAIFEAVRRDAAIEPFLQRARNLEETGNA